MKRTVLIAMFTVSFAAGQTQADGLLFAYEGDVLASDPASGFDVPSPCEQECSSRLENGHFLLEWGPMGMGVAYNRLFGQPGGPPPPPTLWAEWGFRSNQPKPATSFSCDARFRIIYKAAGDTVYPFQDAVVDFSGSDFVLGLDPDIFHTYRFESLDGQNYTHSVDGVVFNIDLDTNLTETAFISFGGVGSCAGFRPQPVRNEWDYIRYGTIETGEQIVSVDPPAGDITNPQGEPLESFTITFDQPAYLYVDDITASVTGGGVAPAVVATRRLDNGPSNVLEIFIEGAMPFDQTTTFSFDTGTGTQSIAYNHVGPGIPASSTWGLVAMGIATAIAGGLIFRNRISA